MKLGLYHCAGLELWKLLSKAEVEDLLIVDPYASVDPQFEKRVRSSPRMACGRAIWTHADVTMGFKRKETLGALLPYTDAETISELCDMQLPHNLVLSDESKEILRFNAKRTIYPDIALPNIDTFIDRLADMWFRYLLHFNPTIFLSAIVPHSLIDLVLAECCRMLKIPFICQVTTGMRHHCFHLNYSSRRYLSNARFSKVSSHDLKDFIYYCGMSSANFRSSYVNSINTSFQTALASQKRNLLLNDESAKLILSRKIELARYYDRLSTLKTIPANVSKIHYLFLHYQPEMTTSPLALRYSNQNLIAKYILNHLPKDEILIIKEHPRQFLDCGILGGRRSHIERCLSFRTPKHYQELMENSYCYFLPRRVKNEQLFKGMRATFWTATGTSSLQAFLNGHDIGSLNTLTPYFMLQNKSAISVDDRYQYTISEMSRYLYPLIRGEQVEDIFLSTESFCDLVLSTAASIQN